MERSNVSNNIFFQNLCVATTNFLPVLLKFSGLIESSCHKYFISGGAKQNIFLFDTENGCVVREIKAPKMVDCMAEGSGLLVCGQSGMECYGHVFNINTGESVSKLQGLYGFSNVLITANGKQVRYQKQLISRGNCFFEFSRTFKNFPGYFVL